MWMYIYICIYIYIYIFIHLFIYSFIRRPCLARAAPGTTVGVELCSLARASMKVAYQILHFYTEAMALACDHHCGQPNPPQQLWQSDTDGWHFPSP